MKTDFSKKRIVIAEDTSFMRTGLVKVLIEIGFKENNIFAFESGKQANDFIKNYQGRFDLVLSDWNMPNMNGLEFLKKIRNSDDYYQKIPFVLLTTVSEKEKVIEALNFQVSYYLLKPLQIPKLKECLEFLLKIEGKENEE